MTDEEVFLMLVDWSYFALDVETGEKEGA